MEYLNTTTTSNSTQNLIFDKIIQDLTELYKNSKTHFISFLLSQDQNELFIKLKLKRDTDINDFEIDLNFYIVIDYYYPESVPYVKSLTNFCNPTIYDGRNLLFSIINQNWTKETTVIDIINGIPDFVARINENFSNKILVYYGDYQIDKVYDMNEIISNGDLDFFKINQKLTKHGKNYTKERYIVVTDIYFLLFDPVPNSRNNARLLFWGDIRQINQNKRKLDTVELEWKGEGENTLIVIEIEFLTSSISDFFERIKDKIQNLKENFKIFQDDINKPTSEEDLSLDEEKLLLLVKFKEDLLVKKFSTNIVKELMNLYQKVIEIKSAKNDDSFTIYLDKLHRMLKNEKSAPETKNSQKSFAPIITNHIKQESIFRMSSQTFSTLNAKCEDDEKTNN